jgi:hypothetical protein
MDNPRVVVRYGGDQWVAYFESVPQVAFGGEKPLNALRRLLEGTEAEQGSYVMQWVQETPDSGTPFWSVSWDPPELLIPCQACEGRGEYVGLLEREVCRACGGKKVVQV